MVKALLPQVTAGLIMRRGQKVVLIRWSVPRTTTLQWQAEWATIPDGG